MSARNALRAYPPFRESLFLGMAARNALRAYPPFREGLFLGMAARNALRAYPLFRVSHFLGIAARNALRAYPPFRGNLFWECRHATHCVPTRRFAKGYLIPVTYYLFNSAFSNTSYISFTK